MPALPGFFMKKCFSPSRLANIQAAGGDVSAAQPVLLQANAAKTAGQFKTACALP